MTFNGWLQIIVFALVILALTRPVGAYMFRVFEGAPADAANARARRARAAAAVRVAQPEGADLGPVRGLDAGVHGDGARRHLPDPARAGLAAGQPAAPRRACGAPLAFNTAASFTTNTNWQSYVPETTMSYFTQMAGLAWHNFTSAAVGIGVALVVARGLTRQPGLDGAKGVGNFYVDLIRATGLRAAADRASSSRSFWCRRA